MNPQDETEARAGSIPLLGYADPLSGRPGDTIEFKVSSRCAAPYRARLVRIICADPNPAGRGLVEEEIESGFAGVYPSRPQPVCAGSYAAAAARGLFRARGSFSLLATIWPTMPRGRRQCIISCRDEESDAGMDLYLDEDGCGASLGGAERVTVHCGEKLRERTWHRVWASYDHRERRLRVCQQALHDGAARCADAAVGRMPDLRQVSIVHIAAFAARPAHGHFNGKIESPAILRRAIHENETGGEKNLHRGVIARWDFSRAISSTRIEDAAGRFDGKLINLPARAMTGSNWDAREMCWRHAPEQYGAIHFHEDDICDFNWRTDFRFTIPENLRPGAYAARIECGREQDAIPFFVCAAPGKPSARVCVLASTFTYTVYGNHARPNFQPAWLERIKAWNAYPWNPAMHRGYGLSTYNEHADGSGICHASHRRPLLSMRPGYITFGEGDCSGLRHLQADSHLIAWLEQKQIEYDLITDRELHEDGEAALAGYRAVITGSHPEYHTAEMLDALQSHRARGGNLLYLGGNGFYWRIALHPEDNGAIEIRRAEGGIRAWAAEPGEYYQAFDGNYGGLWRRNGRPPQQLAGVGFSAQGTFLGSYYRRRPETFTDPDIAWIFEGITDEIIGDFGFSGGGAAGFELDRADTRLGTPEDAVILASSENHADTFMLVPEEQLTHLTTLSGEPANELIRADMLYHINARGGRLFSTGSITFCGSLPHNNGDNNVSRLLWNVLGKFMR
ncbi:MAG: N,N-dimethylformamidase large subunit [Gammaproteobacteria bacterium]